MIRFSKKYSIDEVLSKVIFAKKLKKQQYSVIFDNIPIYMNSDRYITFATKGTVCCKCGINGQYFCMEKHLPTDGRYHFNLYGIDNDGQEVLMTKDHIVPISSGGRNHISNYQTMCTICNSKKANNHNEQ